MNWKKFSRDLKVKKKNPHILISRYICELFATCDHSTYILPPLTAYTVDKCCDYLAYILKNPAARSQNGCKTLIPSLLAFPPSSGREGQPEGPSLLPAAELLNAFPVPGSHELRV